MPGESKYYFNRRTDIVMTGHNDVKFGALKTTL